MKVIRTLDELLHTVTNALCLISTSSQYLLTRQAADEDLDIIHREAERAASLIARVPQHLRNARLDDGLGGSDPRLPAPLFDREEVEYANSKGR